MRDSRAARCGSRRCPDPTARFAGAISARSARRCRRRAACSPRCSLTPSRRPSRHRPATCASRPISQRSRLGVQRTASIHVDGNPLEPDRLPDAGRARIPDRVRLELPVLLAARLRQVGWIVFGAHDDLARRAAVQESRDVDGERRVAAVRGRPPVRDRPRRSPRSRPRRSAGAAARRSPAEARARAGDTSRLCRSSCHGRRCGWFRARTAP